MNETIRQIIKFQLKIFGALISYPLKLKIILKLYNQLYERLPFFIIKQLVKYVDIKIPWENFFWKIILLNKKHIVTKMIKNDIKTWEFALAYKGHSPSLNFTEKILNEYYSKEVPWVDVGANLGLRSLLALSEGRPVFFIEPNQEVNQINIERCKLNEFSNYHLLEYGASNNKDKVEFFIDTTSYKSSINGNNDNDNTHLARKEIIYIDSLDNLLREYSQNWETVCIKIDTEGHELNVIDGLKGIINSFSPTMIVEVDTKDQNLQIFCKKMWDLGYEIYEIRNSYRKKYFNKITKDTIFCNKTFANDFLLIKDQSLQLIIESYI